MATRFIVAMTLSALAASPRMAGGGEGPVHVWWEAEDFAETSVPKPHAPYPRNISPEERSKLSGGTWLSPSGPEAAGPYFITWKVSVPKDAGYGFWVRKFWKHGPFKWRFDQNPWQECGRGITLHDDTYLRKFIGANWVFLGQVKLTEGTHVLRVEMLDAKGGGALDCFVLIDGPFLPRGKLKPGEKSGQSKPGFFAWEPSGDPLSDTCPIDLRQLNEEQAGQDGFVRREGNGFALGSGEPVRFWMVQGDALKTMAPQLMDYRARRLAKYGVNLVRLGMLGLFSNWKKGDTEKFQKALDRLHYLVAALKKQGVYTYLGHLYWHTHVTISESDGFPAYGKGKKPVALLFFDPKMQAFYKRWVQALMAPKNPYTGLPMAKDTAVAFVEIQNESSLLFWTFKPARLVPETRELIEQRFAEWAEAKYGSPQKALDAWGTKGHPSRFYKSSVDRPEEGRLGLYGTGHLTNNDWAVNQRNPKRASDQLQFMVESQKGFYEKMVRDWREELGVRNLIVCSNWKTADPRTLGVLERYSYTAGDTICRNVYFGVKYDPRPKRFYANDVGDTYIDRSALKPPANPAPLTVAHVQDHPYMITENNWTRPNRFRVEWPFLVAAYGPMMGVDGWTFFALDAALWRSRMKVWDVNSPSVLGQFPAAALAFRKGYVKEAAPAVEETLSLRDLYRFKEAALFELSGKDALWVSKISDKEGATDGAASRLDPLAFFVGKVNRRVVDGGEGNIKTSLGTLIDRQAKRVRSLTGEQTWDFGRGVVRLDTPYVQGACGFLKPAGAIELADVTIESRNEYAAVIVVSLDGRPIRESAKILVQAGTEDWPYGFQTQELGEKERITAIGGYPLNVRRIQASVILKNAAVRTPTVLDENGYKTERKASAETVEKGLRIRLPEDSLYTLVD